MAVVFSSSPDFSVLLVHILFVYLQQRVTEWEKNSHPWQNSFSKYLIFMLFKHLNSVFCHYLVPIQKTELFLIFLFSCDVQANMVFAFSLHVLVSCTSYNDISIVLRVKFVKCYTPSAGCFCSC